MRAEPGGLSDDYARAYVRQLDEVAVARVRRSRPLALFWPKVGRLYDGDLLVIGRAVNGWIDRWEPGDGRTPAELADIARHTGQGTVNGCSMGWVLDRWGQRDGGYDTAGSQFWQTVRRVLVAQNPAWADNWASRVAWTNLAKVAPYDGANPPSGMLKAQRGSAGTDLIVREIAELAPHRILALTNRWWFAPFAAALDVDLEEREGLVEAVGRRGEQRIVVAVHPMTRSPQAVADAIVAAFEETTP
jgi:hypothetical protein